MRGFIKWDILVMVLRELVCVGGWGNAGEAGSSNQRRTDEAGSSNQGRLTEPGLGGTVIRGILMKPEAVAGRRPRDPGVTVGGMLAKPEAVIRGVLMKLEAVTRAD